MSQAAVNPADLAAAQEAESQTRTRAFWLSVGPDPPTPPTTPPATTNGHRPAPTITHNERALIDGHRPTDAGNSDRLAELADGRIRYVQKWGRWIVYTGGRWATDEALARRAEALATAAA